LTVSATGTPLVALAGNPNTGKSTIFNRLTGGSAKVGNYPGVTVEREVGRVNCAGRSVRLMDVPGAYSLASRSSEEQIALAAVAGLPPHERPDLVVVVVDGTQLTRNLYLALQVLELGVPIVLALNMVDLVEQSGASVDAEALERVLGVPVVPVSGSQGRGMEELRRRIGEALEVAASRNAPWKWKPSDAALLADVRDVGAAVPDDWHAGDDERRDALALWALLSVDENDELQGLPAALRAAVGRAHDGARQADRDIDEEIIRSRYDWIDTAASEFLVEPEAPGPTATDRIDRVLLNPFVGFGVFLLLMGLVFQSLFAWADPMIGLIETTFGAIGAAVAGALPEGWVTGLLVDGVINGVGSVIVFLPQILLLFFFIGLMEDTGYMARVAFLMDRTMKSLGLHGRAFVPMLSGFACAIPAILATRTIERKRDRLLTMMVVPLMSCSARLPVYGLLIAALYPPDANEPFAQGMLMVAMYVFSTIVALGCAAVLGRTVLKGPRVPLILEMPPYRLPHWFSIVRMMWMRSSVFLHEAGTVIMACTIGMWFLLSFPRGDEIQARYDEQRSAAVSEQEVEQLNSLEAAELLNQSYGGRMGRAIEPTLRPLGFDWKIGVGIIGAFAAREVFVSTMAVVYGLDAETDENSDTLREQIRAQKRPDGSPLYTPLTCFSLMVFFALACQCMSTLAVVKRETGGWGWPTFLFVYMTALAWVTSFVVYQGGRVLGFE